ncbi:MAG: ATP-binding cassette domain-containing protein [Candidatus Firestonebacteria bacterium]|nr:ATP-binding cassette domain-containing protein [Candidatus Firestonebacteria bacterium]
MNLVEAVGLNKSFTTREVSEGFYGALKGLFGFSKKKTHDAVKDFNFTIEKGEIVGLIGPNGAGKSTIVKMAAGIILPTSGSIKTFGLKPFKNRIKIAKKYGVVFGQRSNLWWNLPAIETFKAYLPIYGVDRKEGRKQIDYLAELLDIKDFINKPVRQLSLGQRMRCELASALIHKPELLFLDEPTIGLDVVSKQLVRKYIKKINEEQGVSVLLTSHDMLDVERLCERVMVIDKGLLAYYGPLDPLRDRFAPERYLEIDFETDPGELNVLQAERISKEGNILVFKFDSRKVSCMNILESLKGTCNILDFSVKELPIDEVIAKIYKKGFGK